MNTPNPIRKIKVLLVDDHTIVRQGLRALLEATPDIEVIAEAADGQTAVRLARELQPAVIVMDVHMPVLNGAEATRQILQNAPEAKVLVLSSYNDNERVVDMIERGAIGYVVKQSASNDLVKAIREVKKGNAFLSPCISRHLLERCRNSLAQGEAKNNGNDLTMREAEVLQLVAESYANKQIAGVLSISIKTVEKHRQQLMDKLKIHETAGLTRYAVARGMVEVREPEAAGQPAFC